MSALLRQLWPIISHQRTLHRRPNALQRNRMNTRTDPWIPFWRSGYMEGESLLFLETTPGKPATSSLLVAPNGSVSLKSATGEVEYVDNVDYTVDKASGLLTRTSGSRIPKTTVAELHPSLDPDGSGFMHVRGNPNAF